MWIEGVLDVAKYVSEQIGGEHVFCGVSAIIVLLFLKKVLLFPNAMATIVMFAASAFFLFDHPYSYLISNNSSELSIPLVWFSEISILVALKMLGFFCVGRGDGVPTGSMFLVLASLGLIGVMIYNPQLVSEYIPENEQDTVFIIACAIPPIVAIWRFITIVVPVCLLGGAITAMLMFVVDNKEISDFTHSIDISIDKDELANTYQVGKEALSMVYDSRFK